MGCISSDIFANETLVWEEYDEVETVSGDGVCKIIVIKQSLFFYHWKFCLYVLEKLHNFLQFCQNIRF